MYGRSSFRDLEINQGPWCRLRGGRDTRKVVEDESPGPKRMTPPSDVFNIEGVGVEGRETI